MRRVPLRCAFLNVLCLSVSILAKCEGYESKGRLEDDQTFVESRRRVVTAVPPAALNSAEQPEVFEAMAYEPQRMVASTNVKRRVSYPTLPTTSVPDSAPIPAPRRKRRPKNPKKAHDQLRGKPVSYVGEASDTVNSKATRPSERLPANPRPTEAVTAGYYLIPNPQEAPRPFDMKQYFGIPRGTIQAAPVEPFPTGIPSKVQEIENPSRVSERGTSRPRIQSAYSEVANSFEKNLPLEPIVPAAVVETTVAPSKEVEDEEEQAAYHGEEDSHEALTEVEIPSDDGKRDKRKSRNGESHDEIRQVSGYYDAEETPVLQDKAELAEEKHVSSDNHDDESNLEHSANYEVQEKKSAGGGGGGHGGHGGGKAGGGGGGGGGHGKGKAGGGGGGGDHKFEKGGGEEHMEHEHSSHGEKGDKGYKGIHEYDKGEKGHHDKENHAKSYSEKKGNEKKHHDEGGYHGEHHHGEKGSKEAKFGEKGEHKKGHNTKGQHFIHKKDEYEKKTEFFDEFHEDGGNEKDGEFHHEHSEKKGGHHKSEHHDAAEHEEKHGKEKKHEEGHHHSDHKGHKKADGHEVHHAHHDKYGKKEGHDEGKKWKYEKGDGGGAGGGKAAGGGGGGGNSHH